MTFDRRYALAALTAGFGDDKDAAAVFKKVTDAAFYGRGARFTDFIDPVKAARVVAVFGDEECRLFGGVAYAERVLVGFCSDYLDADFALAEDRFPITRLKITPRLRGVLAHKDYLGAICAVTDRAKVGDIYASDSAAYVVVKTEAADTLLFGLTEVGRCDVTCESVDYVDFCGVNTAAEKTVFAASTRVDCVVAKCLNMSRGQVTDAINLGSVFVNWLVCKSGSASVKDGDVLNARGVGRFKITTISVTARDRVKVDYLLWAGV